MIELDLIDWEVEWFIILWLCHYVIIVIITYSNVGSGWVKKDVDIIYEKIDWVFTNQYSHVAGNHQRQRDIFDALSLNDFTKILANLKDENECKM